MLSKILVRSGLSRLLWIKDAASHRLNGCVLELVWAAMVLIWDLTSKSLSTRSLLPGRYFVAPTRTASLSLSTAVHQLF